MRQLTFDEYQRDAARTINPELNTIQMIYHSLFGLAAESGEVCGLYQKLMQGHRLEREHLIKEIGDVLWMLGELCTATEITMDECAVTNIEKLKARYPRGFTTEESLHRKEGDI